MGSWIRWPPCAAQYDVHTFNKIIKHALYNVEYVFKIIIKITKFIKSKIVLEIMK